MCLFGRVELQTEHPRYVRVNNSLGNFRSRESVPGNLFKYKNVVLMDISRCDAVSRTLKFPSIQWIALSILRFVLIFPSKEKNWITVAI